MATAHSDRGSEFILLCRLCLSNFCSEISRQRAAKHNGRSHRRPSTNDSNQGTPRNNQNVTCHVLCLDPANTNNTMVPEWSGENFTALSQSQLVPMGMDQLYFSQLMMLRFSLLRFCPLRFTPLTFVVLQIWN